MFEQFLLEGKWIDKTFGIIPWKAEKPLPTVYNASEIRKLLYNSLIQYLRGPMQGQYIIQIVTGRNYGDSMQLSKMKNQKFFKNTGPEMSLTH